MISTGPFDKNERIKPGVRMRALRLRTVPTWTEAKLWERLRKLDIRIRRQPPIGPRPLEGEGAGGWGEAPPHLEMTQAAQSRLARSINKPPANTPTQPSPLEGEGS